MTCDPWPVVWCGEGPPADTTPDQQDAAVAEASEVLAALSGFQFGRCRRTFTVTGPDLCTVWPPQVAPQGLYPCCVVEVGINAEVHLVTVDGAPFTEWFVSGRWLIRSDGQCWPTGALCDPPRTVIELTTGMHPPDIAQRAVGELAEQILAACTGAGECVLPSRVVSVNRQGIGMNLLDPMDYTASGKLGLPISDMFLMSFNPDKLRRNSGVVSPDTRRVQWLS